ncbi:ribonuclease H-like domain-containing protein [Tanacetum coccineum]
MAVNDNINKSGDDANKNHDDIGSSSDLNLSFGETLYLHPNDTSGSPIVTINNHGLANQWCMCNSVVVTWILISLSPDLYAGAIYAKTAFEIWSDLKETYDKVDGSAKQFDVMISLPPFTCEAAKHFEKHNQLIKLMQFLMGFDESYLAIRSNILTRKTLPLVKEAFAIISGEESHRNVTSVGATKPAATAFAAKTFDNKRRPNNNSNFNKGCFELVGYPAGYVKRNFNSSTRHVSSNNASVDGHSICAGSNNATTNISPVSLSNEQLSRLMNLLSDNGVSSANANMAVNVVDILNLGLTVRHPNGTQSLITKIGDLKVSNGITLYDILVVPEYTVSILSVHNIARDNDFSRAVWVYMLKGKDDVYDSIISFVQMLTNQFKTNVKVFRSDNGIEFGELSLYLWSKCILTVVYLISKIPSSVLSGKSPFYFVYGHDLSLSHFKLSFVDQNDDDSGATSIDENIHPEGNVSDETDIVGLFL